MELAGDGWGNFFVATAGAAGALSGLVFVALSINLNRILAIPGVSGRAAETVILLAAVLIGALVGLIPGQTPAELGIELTALVLPTWIVPNVIQIRSLRHRQHKRLLHAIVRFSLHQLATIPMMLAGLSLLGYLGGGLRWLALGLLLSLAVGLINAWVLLLEILR